MPILKEGKNKCPKCGRINFEVTHEGIVIKCAKCKHKIKFINPKIEEAIYKELNS